MNLEPDSAICLPTDAAEAVLVGRAWTTAGPSVVTVRNDEVVDISASVPTVAELTARKDAVRLLRSVDGPSLGSVQQLLDNTVEARRDPGLPWLLAPVDLHAIKACGVTFAASALERVIEERAQGDPRQAETLRETLSSELGESFDSVRPGSEAAMQLKQLLIGRGLWSQYLEVAIGPDAEVFTKAQPLSAVGSCASVGLHPASEWNNPEPEVVLVIAPDGRIVGATLGNDVNLRDFEGRSALLLGKAKDNNASTAIGPFLRLFAGDFDLDRVRNASVQLEIRGDDGYILQSEGSMRGISRDIEDLSAQTLNRNHQYPDGLVLFTGSLFAPVDDRDEPGMGFTHHPGDLVRIHWSDLGTLENLVTTSDKAPPWTFGTTALLRNLAARGLL